MEKEIENKKRRLEQWLLSILEALRERYNGLDEWSRSQFKDVDLRDNMQFEVFWLEYPENQVIVFTVDNTRDDGEVLIHGPSEINSLLDIIIEVMQTARWNRSIPADLSRFKQGTNDEVTYAQRFQSLFIHFVHVIRKEVFTKSLEYAYFSRLSKRDICILFRGNIAEYSANTLITTILNMFTPDPFFVSESMKAKEARRASWPMGHGSYFYPPLWIGKKPEKDFKLEALGVDYFVPTASNFEFRGEDVTIYSNGFVGLQTKDKTEAQKSLNTIFGTTALSGIDCLKANESEVQEIQIEPQSSKIVSQSALPEYSLRSPLSEDRISEISHLRELSIQKIEELIKRADLISGYEVSTDLLLWFEGYNHLHNGEYNQSFVMNWIVIERHLYSLLEAHLRKLESEGSLSKRKSKDLRRLNVAYVLLFLRATECIDENDYSTLSKLNKNRNGLVHRGTSISHRISKDCLKCSKVIINKRIADLGI
jgi:hypothetical protein